MPAELFLPHSGTQTVRAVYVDGVVHGALETFSAAGPAVLASTASALYSAGGPRPPAALAALAADAAAWRCERDGHSLPDAVAAGAAAAGAPPEAPQQLRRLQRDLLPVVDQDVLAGWVPALVRAFAAESGGDEHLSAEPLLEVACAALTARVRPEQGRPVALYDPACGTGGTLCAASLALSALGASVLACVPDVCCKATLTRYDHAEVMRRWRPHLTARPRRPSPGPSDHPRVGGENLDGLNETAFMLGPPPRRRGEHEEGPDEGPDPGTTPA